MKKRTTIEEPSPAARTRAVLDLVEKWLADDSGYEEEAWPRLKEAIERDRLSYRKRFSE